MASRESGLRCGCEGRSGWTRSDSERIRHRLAVKNEAEPEREFYEAIKAGLSIQVNRELVEVIRQQLRTNEARVKPSGAAR